MSEEQVQRLTNFALSSFAAAAEVNGKYRHWLPALFEDGRVVEKFRTDPVWGTAFLFGYKASPYQADILTDNSKRIDVELTRQGGKTTTIGAKVLWHILAHKRHNVLVISPSLRQSLIFRNKMDLHLLNMPASLRQAFFRRIQRTQMFATNGSSLYALPNSPEKLKGFTANLIVLDEFAVFKDADVLLDEVVSPMLFTTNGDIWVLTTPKTKTHRLWDIHNDTAYSHHHVTWREAVRAGIGSCWPVWQALRPQLSAAAKQSMEAQLAKHPNALSDAEVGIMLIDKVLKEFGTPTLFRSEFEAEFIEDEDAALPYDWLVACIDSDRSYDWLPFERPAEGVFYGGIDFGKKMSHSVITVGRVEQHNGARVVNLVHSKVFDFDTPYGVVLGYAKVLNERWHTFAKWLGDQTGVGEYIIEDGKKLVRTLEGVTLSSPMEHEVISYVRQQYLDHKVLLPYDQWLLEELNRQRIELTKEGKEKYPKPQAGNDVFWSHNLCLYAARQEKRGGAAAV